MDKRRGKITLITRNHYLEDKEYSMEEEIEIIQICLETIQQYEEEIENWGMENPNKRLVALSIDCINKYEKDHNTRLKW